MASASQVAAKSAKSTVVVLRHWISDWVVTFLFLLFGTATLLQAFVVPTGSLEPNILIGDHLFVDKLAYAPAGAFSRHILPYSDVKRGDIIVFRYPLNISQNYVKRVIGLPGDHIRFVNKQLYLNGHAAAEPYKIHMPGFSQPYLDNFPANLDINIFSRGEQMLRENVVNGELVVPPGMYFALGDNRDNSEDSRFWGFVPRENITGKPILVWWSYDAKTAELSQGIPSIEHVFDIATHFFTKTRWNRMFRPIRGYPLQ